MTVLPVNPCFLLGLSTGKLCPWQAGLVFGPVMTVLPVASGRTWPGCNFWPVTMTIGGVWAQILAQLLCEV